MSAVEPVQVKSVGAIDSGSSVALRRLAQNKQNKTLQFYDDNPFQASEQGVYVAGP